MWASKSEQYYFTQTHWRRPSGIYLEKSYLQSLEILGQKGRFFEREHAAYQSIPQAIQLVPDNWHSPPSPRRKCSELSSVIQRTNLYVESWLYIFLIWLNRSRLITRYALYRITSLLHFKTGNQQSYLLISLYDTFCPWNVDQQ